MINSGGLVDSSPSRRNSANASDLEKKRDFSKMSERLMKSAALGTSDRFVLVNWKLLK